jgi:PAS domain-containing protein
MLVPAWPDVRWRVLEKRTEMTKRMSVGRICDQMAALARTRQLKSLSMWLKMASNEAYLHALDMEASLDDRIGVWDWDVGNDVTYTNAVCGAFFGKRPDEAAKGRRIETYTSLIHEHDRAHFNAELGRSVKSGLPFFSEYRVIVGSALRWIRADGNCMVDPSGKPIKIMGSAIDITEERRALGHC